MPPAPPGGSIGMAPNGGWASSGARTGMENKNSRVPGAVRAGKTNQSGSQGPAFRRSLDSRGNELNPARIRYGAEIANQPSSQREGGLPPKPPSSAYQTWSGHQNNRAGWDRGRQNRFGGRPEGNIDSYVPNHRGSGERLRARYDDSPSSNADGRDRPESHQASRRDNYRDHASRNRSRSPGMRVGDRSIDRGLYRR